MADNINYAMLSRCERIVLAGLCPAEDDTCSTDCEGYRPPDFGSPKEIRETYYRNRRIKAK